jgi:hypothetical protein
MPQLQIKEIPVDLYENISKTAEAENRDLSQQVIILLQSALDLHRNRINKLKPVFNEIDSLQIKNANTFPDPVELVREDRDK